MAKTALISGVTGQDGAYLADFLLNQGYNVHGIKRRSSQFNTERIDHLYQDPHVTDQSFFLHYGDLSDSTNLIRIIQEVQPDEIYNLGAMSHVAVSFATPEYTANVDGIGALRLLEAIRILKLENKTRFYQASTSELYGLVQEVPQTEKTPFYPRSPYAVAKLYACTSCNKGTTKLSQLPSGENSAPQPHHCVSFDTGIVDPFCKSNHQSRGGPGVVLGATKTRLS